jgi:hypothetical protein
MQRRQPRMRLELHRLIFIDETAVISQPFNFDYFLLYDLPRIVLPPHFRYS